ncbi:uncharacterized protein LOC134815335 [Bolinopsis microptera]|uniref:uncharacterized protein LOC134815335 n=1 Tax=Bolinopsis microptera TaxID=2820187 RepID=UPI0030791D7D
MFKTFILVTALCFTLGHAEIKDKDYSITVISGSYAFNMVVSGLADGDSLLEAMNKAKTEEKFTFEMSEDSVTSINAVEPEDAGTHYWQAAAKIGDMWEPLAHDISKGVHADKYKWTIVEIQTDANVSGSTVTSPGFWMITTTILASLLLS